MTKVITVDLDSTLYDTGHRHAFIDRTGKTDWVAYSKLCVHDTVIEATANLCRLAKLAGFEVHFVTGRMTQAREETIAKLVEDNVPMDGLWMDETLSGDHIAEYGSHSLYKAIRIEQLVAEHGWDVWFHIDDYAEVKLELEKRGIPCIGVRTPQEVLSFTGSLA